MIPMVEGEHSIPRVVHWLWLGTNAVPRIFEQYADRWRAHHPAWQTRLWRDDTLPALGCQELLDTATGFKRRYDIVRLEILRQHGGVIVDMDVEPIRPLDPLLHGVSAFVGRLGETHIGNQVLGATPRHPFFERAVDDLRSNTDDSRNSSETAGKEFLKQVLTQYPEGVTVFPARTFYYEPSFEPPRRPDDFPDVYAVHHQLESYAAVPQAETVERRFDQFVSEVTRAWNTLSGTQTASAPPFAPIEETLARLAKAERRVRRAVSGDGNRHRAQLHAVRAELEQAVVRFNEHERDWRRRLDEAQMRQADTRQQPAKGDQRSLVRRLRRLLAWWRG